MEDNKNVVPSSYPRPLRVEEIHSVTEQKRRKLFSRLVEGRWGISANPPPNVSDTENKTVYEEY